MIALNCDRKVYPENIPVLDSVVDASKCLIAVLVVVRGVRGCLVDV